MRRVVRIIGGILALAGVLGGLVFFIAAAVMG